MARRKKNTERQICFHILDPYYIKILFKLFNILQEMEKSDRIYHCCFTKNRDGTNQIIEKNKAILIPTNNPFWNYPEGTPRGVKTQSQEKN